MCTFFRIASAAQYVTAGFEPIQLRGQLSDRTSTHTWAPSASEVRRQLAMCTLDVLCVTKIIHYDRFPRFILLGGATLPYINNGVFPNFFPTQDPSSSPAVFSPFFSFFLLHFQCVIACDLRCDMRPVFPLGCVIACDLLCDIGLIHNALMYYKPPLITE